jgi:hypothetical protein
MSKPEVRSDFFSYLVSDELIIKSLCPPPIIFFKKQDINPTILMTNGEANLHNSVLIGN